MRWKRRMFHSILTGANYIKINSGLGQSQTFQLIILPVFENNVKAVIELASLDISVGKHIDFAAAY